jgi:hypothetical protein
MVVHKKFTLHQLTPTGGRSSCTEVKTSLTSKTRRYLMSIKRKILKDKNVLFIEDTMAGTRDGESSMLTKQPRKEPQDSIKSMDSIS